MPSNTRPVYCAPDTALDSDGRYVVREQIGVGKFCSVQLCTNGLVVKVLHLCLCLSRPCKKPGCTIRQMYENERRYVQRMRERDHRNLVKAFEMWESPQGSQCISMEDLEGVTLDSKRRRTQGLIPENYAACVARDIYSGLHYLETVLHIRTLDLKPANIIQRTRCSDWISTPWVLIDFGLSEGIESTKAVVESSKGTLAYSAPEKFGEVGDGVGKRALEVSNVFTVGAIIFEVILDRHLFDARDPVAPEHAQENKGKMLDRVTDSFYAQNQVHKYLTGVSNLCEKHVRKCLEFKPENRYGTTYLALTSEWIEQFKTEDGKYDFSKMPIPKPQQPQQGTKPPQAQARAQAQAPQSSHHTQQGTQAKKDPQTTLGRVGSRRRAKAYAQLTTGPVPIPVPGPALPPPKLSSEGQRRALKDLATTTTTPPRTSSSSSTPTSTPNPTPVPISTSAPTTNKSPSPSSEAGPRIAKLPIQNAQQQQQQQPKKVPTPKMSGLKGVRVPSPKPASSTSAPTSTATASGAGAKSPTRTVATTGSTTAMTTTKSAITRRSGVSGTTGLGTGSGAGAGATSNPTAAKTSTPTPPLPTTAKTSKTSKNGDKDKSKSKADDKKKSKRGGGPCGCFSSK